MEKAGLEALGLGEADRVDRSFRPGNPVVLEPVESSPPDAASGPSAGSSWRASSPEIGVAPRIQEVADPRWAFPPNADPLWQVELSEAFSNRALSTADPRDWVWALDLAERAVAKDPSLDSAWSQRARCLVRLGLWRSLGPSFRAGERTSDEARPLSLEPRGWEAARAEFDRNPTPGGARELLRVFPERARLLAEEEILPLWATAYEAGQIQVSDRRLEQARLLGAELSGERGDRLVAEAVVAIERASLQPASRRRARMVAGHRLLGEGIGLYYQNPKFEGAGEKLARAEEAFRASASPMALLAGYYKALVDRYQDRREEAVRQLTASEPAAGQRSFLYLQARILGSLGVLALDDGELSRALRFDRLALAASERAGEPVYAAYLHSSLAELGSRWGEEEASWRHRFFALHGVERFARPRRVYSVLRGAAESARILGAPAAALSFNAELLARLPSGQPDLLAETLAQRSRIFSDLDEREEAGKALLAAWEALPEVEDPSFRRRVEADLWIAAGRLFEGDAPGQAQVSLDKAIALFEERRLPLELAELLRARAHAALLQGRMEQAGADLDRAVAAIENQREKLDDPDSRASYFEKIRRVYDEAIDLEQLRRDADKSFLRSEQMRGRLLLDRLALRNAGSQEPSAPLSLQAVRRSLPAGMALLEYAVLPNRLIVWVVRRERVESFVQAIPSREVKARVASLRRLIRRGGPRKELEETAGALFSLLVKPELLNGVSHLILVPDKALHQVPFAGLWNPRTRRFMVEDFALSLAPSATLAVAALERERSLGAGREFGSPLILGNPRFDPDVFHGLRRLPNAEEEARTLAALYGTTPVLGEAATRTRFLEQLPRAEVVHFAGHTVEMGRVPEDRSLLFAQDLGSPAPEGSLVSARQLAAFSLPRTRLVVLGGCSTTAGPVLASEGPMSLARPFLAAGVPAVVGTLWNVDDRVAKKIFLSFHRFWKGGDDAAAALRKAQLELIQELESRRISLDKWAGFQLIGL